MPNWLLVILLPLAVYRVAFMVATEEGPFSVFARLRFAMKDNTLGDMLSCIYCLSVWIAGGLLVYYGLPVYEWLVGTMAVSALAIWIHHEVRR